MRRARTRAREGKCRSRCHRQPRSRIDGPAELGFCPEKSSGAIRLPVGRDNRVPVLGNCGLQLPARCAQGPPTPHPQARVPLRVSFQAGCLVPAPARQGACPGGRGRGREPPLLCSAAPAAGRAYPHGEGRGTGFWGLRGPFLVHEGRRERPGAPERRHFWSRSAIKRIHFEHGPSPGCVAALRKACGGRQGGTGTPRGVGAGSPDPGGRQHTSRGATEAARAVEGARLARPRAPGLPRRGGGVASASAMFPNTESRGSAHRGAAGPGRGGPLPSPA